MNGKTSAEAIIYSIPRTAIVSEMHFVLVEIINDANLRRAATTKDVTQEPT